MFSMNVPRFFAPVFVVSLLVLHVPPLQAQQPIPACPQVPDSLRASAPSIAVDVDPAARYLAGDSVRIGLALDKAPPGAVIGFTATGLDGATVDGGNIVRWRAARGSEGFRYLNIAAVEGTTVIACRQLRLAVERAQRAPVMRISSKQVQAGTILEFTVNATDPDGDSLSFAISDMPAGVPPATLDSTGRFRWRAPYTAGATGNAYPFKIEVSDGLNISAVVFTAVVSGLNVRPECPVTIASVSASEGATIMLPLGATDANGDILRYRPERDLPGGAVDSAGYRWEIPWGTVDNSVNERSFDFLWRAIDPQNMQSDLCTTRVTVRARMEPERLRTEQEAHARFFASAVATGQDLEKRLETLRMKINANDTARRRRSIASLATALLAGTFQLAGAEDTRRIAGGINTLTSVFFSGFNALAPGTDGFKSDARKFEDQIAKYSQLMSAFRISYGDRISEQLLRSAQYRTDRTALDAEQVRAAALLR